MNSFRGGVDANRSGDSGDMMSDARQAGCGPGGYDPYISSHVTHQESLSAPVSHRLTGWPVTALPARLMTPEFGTRSVASDLFLFLNKRRP